MHNHGFRAPTTAESEPASHPDATLQQRPERRTRLPGRVRIADIVVILHEDANANRLQALDLGRRCCGSAVDSRLRSSNPAEHRAPYPSLLGRHQTQYEERR